MFPDKPAPSQPEPTRPARRRPASMRSRTLARGRAVSRARRRTAKSAPTGERSRRPNRGRTAAKLPESLLPSREPRAPCRDPQCAPATSRPPSARTTTIRPRRPGSRNAGGLSATERSGRWSLLEVSLNLPGLVDVDLDQFAQRQQLVLQYLLVRLRDELRIEQFDRGLVRLHL